MANAALAPDGPPDKELLDRVRSGGRAGDAAVTAIYKRYRLPLLRFFVSQGLTPDDASDVLQETVIRIVRGAASYTGEGAARSWIWQVARNSLTDVLRKRKLLREHEAPFDDFEEVLGTVEDDAPNPEEASGADAMRKCVEKGMAAFRQVTPDRHFVLMLQAQEHSIEEISQRIGRTAGATKVYLFQCREKLRPFLQPCRGFLSA